MPAPKKSFDEVRIPFTKMTFAPDVPSAALGPNEYNSGSNVETDVRGIRSVLGDKAILPDGIPGTPTFVTAGYRQPVQGVTNDFYFIVATVEGKWWASNGEAMTTETHLVTELGKLNVRDHGPATAGIWFATDGAEDVLGVRECLFKFFVKMGAVLPPAMSC